MEFGSFDDDLFAEEKPKKSPREQVQYTPKVCTQQWFSHGECPPQDTADLMQLCIYRGDDLYYRGEWAPAAAAYAEALGLVAPNNPTMRRLLLESLARCRLKYGDVGGAVEMGRKLLEESTSEDQLVGAHSLLAMLYDAAETVHEQIKSLKFCLDVRPSSSQHLIQLAKTYLRLSGVGNFKKYNLRDAETLPCKMCCDGRVGKPCRLEACVDQASVTVESGAGFYGSTLDQSDKMSKVKCVCAPLHSQGRAVPHPWARDAKCKQRGHESKSTIGSSNSNTHTYEAQSGSGGQMNEQCVMRTGEGSAFAYGTVEGNRPSCLHGFQGSNSRNGVANNLEDPSDPAPGVDGTERRLVASFRQASLIDRGRAVLHHNGMTEITGQLITESAKCLVQAQFHLKSIQTGTPSPAKERTFELLAEVEQLLDSLPMDSSTLTCIRDQAAGRMTDN